MTKLEKFLDMFRGPSGGYDTARILFGIAGFNGAVAPIVFQVWALVKDQTWNAIEFCSGYGILLASFAAVGFGIRQKDKGVADAQATMSNMENSQ